MKKLKHLPILLLLGLVLLLAAWPREAYAEEATTAITVKVGYFGGPYYEKAVLTLDDLGSLEEQHYLYTFLDRGSFLAYADADGYLLTDILELAGIDVNSINRCHFKTTDVGEGTYFASIDSKTLFGSTRYAFPNLSQYYGTPSGEYTNQVTDMEAVWSSATQVPAILSFYDNYSRVDTFTKYNPDRYAYTRDKGLRLFFGQTAPNTVNANQMAKWIYEIDVELGGTPKLVVDDDQLKLKVGSDYRARISVVSGDDTVSEELLKSLQWTSSDESVVKVDSTGKITVVGEGEATITAYLPDYEGRVSPVTIHIVTGKGENLDGGGTGSKGSGTTGGQNGTGKTPSSGKTSDKTTGDKTIIPVGALDEKRLVLRARKLSVTADDILGSAENWAETDEKAGVQNWRDKAMDDDSTALGLIKQGNPLAIFVAAASITILLAGGVYMYLRYKRQMKE